MKGTFFDEVKQTLLPDPEHFGPLPPLFIAMTLVTGLVDAFSYLVLGHVFVANMTGNVVFLGFAVAGAHGFSIAAPLIALSSFGVGSIIGGRLTTKFGHHRGMVLAAATSVQAALLTIAVVLALVAADPPQSAFRYVLIVVLGMAMGDQNATVRKLAVPDLSTTVLTMTVTGIGADSALGGGQGSKSGRRLISIAAMCIGAFIGALLVLHVRIVLPLAIALVLTLLVALGSYLTGRSNPAWTRVDS